MKAEELSDANTVQSKADGKAILERTNDITMKQTKDGSLFAVWVVANQNKIDYSMPARVMLQEALEYDKQLKAMKRKNKESGKDGTWADAGEFLSKIKRTDRLNPVITLVVYWGNEKWQGAETLHDIINFGKNVELAEKLKCMIPKYPLHILDLAENQNYESFQTELRTLFELYARRNDKNRFKEYLQNREECKKLDAETIWTLGKLVNIKALREYEAERKEEEIDMCKAFDEWLADEREEGREEGKTSGRLGLLYELVQDGLLSMKEAAEKAGMAENVFAVGMKNAE